MPIVNLEIASFRNLRSLSIQPSPALNWFIGKNGSGKTSLLEALFLISTGRTFRSSNARHYIANGASCCRVVTSLSAEDENCFSDVVGIERDSEGKFTARRNGQNIRKLSDLARLFPMVTLLPDSVELLCGEPAARREFIDWTMFHVEHNGDYLEVYRKYTLALQSRNKLLRDFNGRSLGYLNLSQIKQLDAWDEQFAYWGERLGEYRQQFLAHFFSLLCSSQTDYPEAFGNPSYQLQQVSFTYQRGWSAGKTLEELLSESRERDLERGTSTQGPHRFDFKVFYEGLQVKDYFSRGQIKHLTSLFKIAQARLFQDTHQAGEVCFLFDDAFAELDSRHAISIISVLRSLGIQMFVTSVEAPETKGFSAGIHDKMFHVKHGCIDQISVPIPPEHI